MLEDGTEQIGDLSDDEGETLERKIARLKREIQEAKEEFGKQKAEGAGSTAVQDEDFPSLSQALDEMSIVPVTKTPATVKPPTKPQDAPSEALAAADGATYTVTYAPDYEQSHALAKAADFDRRLVLLEKAIGITSSALPGIESNGSARAIMPALDTLQKQMLVLNEASTASLDSLARRIRNIASEAEQLETKKIREKAAQEALASADEPINFEDTEQMAKINALYGTLPTIENLTPLLPPLLDRLRSLRAIHADAAVASETLERIENAQGEMAADIKQWRDGLEKMETAMQEGDQAMNANTKVVEGWVKDLEARMAKLS